ncbi:MAG TPA: MATE family efflux transporter [Bryobacteraceae bacterium]|jgi:MATE family multidrug resistance protein
MLRLALPLILAELAWVSMGIVDTMMVGHLPNSAEAIGGASLAGVIFSVAGIFGIGLLMGMDTLVSQSFGAGNTEDCNKSLWNMVYLTLPLAPILMGLVRLSLYFLHRFGINPGVEDVAEPYMQTLLWSMLPLLLYSGCRRYLQGVDDVKPVPFVLITANVINFAGNWLLIYGKFGLPAMGTQGSALSTVVARIYMAAAMMYFVIRHDRRRGGRLWQVSKRPEFKRMWRLLQIGFPAAGQIAFEIGVFSFATAIVAKLDARALAAHQIALSAVSFSYMVPLGISSAAAVRVGQALGRGDSAAARQEGWTAVRLALYFMGAMALIFLAIPSLIARIFTPDPQVIAASDGLLGIAAAFQLFDGAQVVATGALRGMGDSHTAALVNLIAYWFIGIPAGWELCFHYGWGARGVWAGLCIGLVLIGSSLLWTWERKTRSWEADRPPLACPTK